MPEVVDEQDFHATRASPGDKDKIPGRGIVEQAPFLRRRSGLNNQTIRGDMKQRHGRREPVKSPGSAGPT
ncbi:hypothetical protein [Lentzea flava]|uniref:Uncharacterized protein n=1 Tax=Lentzea flava TaxID=103732 RepID=A0ABQ2VHK4_9PSEU|nr:hypothetical protein [Lentzea flava]GGU84431.1 hypothetical protein GCM10010178_88400 [Lentzea flava]